MAAANAILRQLVENPPKYVAVVGKNCGCIEELLEELIAYESLTRDVFILTSSHPNESRDGVLEIMSCLGGDYAGPTGVIEF